MARITCSQLSPADGAGTCSPGPVGEDQTQPVTAQPVAAHYCYCTAHNPDRMQQGSAVFTVRPEHRH